MSLEQLTRDPRVAVRRNGAPNPEGRCVVYWMQRAQRGLDNPALNTAIEAANALDLPVAVFFGLHPRFPNSNLRHYAFLLDGIDETRRRVEQRNCAFVFRPWPEHDLITFCEEVNAALVVGDENPMREPESWRRSASEKLRVPFWTVDADVIVPASSFPNEEYAAYTIRPKLHRLLPVFLHPLSNPEARRGWDEENRPASRKVDSARLLAELPIDRGASPVAVRGGTTEALRRLDDFIKNGLANYDAGRNLPDRQGSSELSAYLHFGHIGPHTVSVAVRDSRAAQAAKDAFLEQLIVRRELAVNFVARNPDYDTLAGCHAWARKTLEEHASDPRPYLYTESQLESASTADSLWNAAQREMMLSGRMHGYLRMYWAKKILEWSESPEAAFEIAVRLNDKYELDGRDPNGYAGIAWSIGAKHDRPWAPMRPVFGSIRYMSAAGCARKFDVKSYIDRVDAMEQGRLW